MGDGVLEDGAALMEFGWDGFLFARLAICWRRSEGGERDVDFVDVEGVGLGALRFQLHDADLRGVGLEGLEIGFGVAGRGRDLDLRVAFLPRGEGLHDGFAEAGDIGKFFAEVFAEFL